MLLLLGTSMTDEDSLLGEIQLWLTASPAGDLLLLTTVMFISGRG